MRLFPTLGRFFGWLNATGLTTLHGAIRLWHRMTLTDKLRIAGLATLLLALVYTVNWSPWARAFTPETLQARVGQWRGWAGAAYILLYAVGTIICVPQTPMVQVGAAVFGTMFGGVWALCGMTIGAAASYWIAVAFGTSVVRNALGPSYDSVQQHMRAGLELDWRWLSFLRRHPFSLVPQSFWGVLLLRLVSIPFPAVSYLAGVMRVPFFPFITATFVGAAPGAFLFAYLYTHGIPWLPYLLDHWTLVLFGLPLLLLSMYFIMYLVYYRIWFGRERFWALVQIPEKEDGA